uniref:Aromatic amino acid beta-eliminating lyase/threonine aldolase domain-containing protein n=1 Tax=Cairina moschata TaxID=8855 RepID=A0A8C3CQK5_CAIMO
MLAVRGAGAALRRAWLHGPGPRRGSRVNGGTGVGGDAWPVWGGVALGCVQAAGSRLGVTAGLSTAWMGCTGPSQSRRPQHVVDLRSDTVTQPSEAMRRAMAQAAVGDDDYGEDPTVNELQHLAARLLGMEDALFVPTATMANLIAVMCHCQRRGAQLLLGAGAHLHVYEHGGVAQVAGVHSQALQDLPDGTLDLEQLELAVREAHGSRYHPRPELVCLENTHSSAGGRVLPLAHLQQVHQLAERYGLRVHMDGARLLNAAVAQAVEPAQITQHCDSVSLCFSKVSRGRGGSARGWTGAAQAAASPSFGPRGRGCVPAHGQGRAALRLPPWTPRAWAPQLGPCWLAAGRLWRRPGACGSCWAEGCGRRGCWQPLPASGWSRQRRRCAETTATPGASLEVPRALGRGPQPGLWAGLERPPLREAGHRAGSPTAPASLRHPGAAVTSVLRQPPGRGDEHGDGGGAGGLAVSGRALRVHAGSERGGAG